MRLSNNASFPESAAIFQIAGDMLVGCWRYAGVSAGGIAGDMLVISIFCFYLLIFMLAICWLFAGGIAGDMLAICWLFAGDMLAISSAISCGVSFENIGLWDSSGCHFSDFELFCCCVFESETGVLQEISEDGSSNKFQGRYAFFLKRFF